MNKNNLVANICEELDGSLTYLTPENCVVVVFKYVAHYEQFLKCKANCTNLRTFVYYDATVSTGL